MEYDTVLKNRFGSLRIDLVKHDVSTTGLPAYIEVHLGATPKDKGSTALDLGNYLYRCFGLRYQSTPEYRGRGKSTTLRWFMTWNDLEPIRLNILKLMKADKAEQFLPWDFYSLPIQKAEAT